jgi:hypothetical protein
MKKGVVGNIVSLVVSLIVSTWTFQVKADAFVFVEFFGVSPNPVNIVEGEVVYWIDGDDFGPYTIFSSSGAWSPFETPGGILFDVAGTYNYFTDVGDSGTVNVSPNLPPSVTITNPAANAVLTAPASFTFAVDAFDTDNGMSDVEFYVGNNLIDDVFIEPYSTEVTNLPAGNYTLTAIAFDMAYKTATNSISITVQNPSVGPIVLSVPTIVSGQIRFTATGLTIGKTNVLQASTNLGSLASWVSIKTNVASSSSLSFTNAVGTGRSFFRLLQRP